MALPAEVFPRNETPAYVERLESVRVFSIYDRIDTGVDLAPGRLYSVMAKGRVFLEPSDAGRGPSDRRFVKVIGKGPQTPVFLNEVGDTFVVSDTGSFGINATVLGKNSVTTPAGTIDEAYLLRFDYTPLAEGALEGTQYYILSPEVGFVALFSVAAGDEASGFTALDSAQVLVTMPEKR